MRKLWFLTFIIIFLSCSITKRSSSLQPEEQISLTRRYIGNFIDYYHTDPKVVGGKDIIWIKTTVYNSFGKISAYGQKCDFSVGDKIYLKSISSSPDKYGNWVFQIENDYTVSYRVSEYRFENNSFTSTRAL
jgi:hypothetical protein